MIIIVIGLPGTGKTTFSRALAQVIDAVHLNTDMIRDDLDLRGHYDRQTKALIYQEMMNRVQAALEKGSHVIVDGTFYRRKNREGYRKLAKAQAVDLKWIELKAQEQAIRDRVAKKRKYSEADFKVYLKIKALFEPMRLACLELQTDREKDLQVLVDEAVQYLGLTA
ncbi:MAG: AAA family ATPase [Bacteroidota bacterium]